MRNRLSSTGFFVFVIGLIGGLTGCYQPNATNFSEQVQGSEYNSVAFDESEELHWILDIVEGRSISVEERQYAFEAFHNRIEELIAACMERSGFSYLPRPVPITPVDTVAPELDNRDWVAQWGYAIVNRPYQSEEDARVEEAAQDPNNSILREMSETELAAFSSALNGAPPEFEGGCIDWAYQQPQPPKPSDLLASDEFAPLFTALNEMYANLQFELSEPERDWSNCMADKSYPGFQRPWDAQQSISDAYMNWHDTQDWDTLRENGEMPTASTSPELSALAEREIDLALADLDCRELVEFQNRMDLRQREAEAQFYRDNRAALRALRDAAEQLSR